MSRLILVLMIFAAVMISPTAVSQTCHQYSAVEVVLGGCEVTTQVVFTAELSSISTHFVPLTAVIGLLGIYMFIGLQNNLVMAPAKVPVKPQTPPPRQ